MRRPGPPVPAARAAATRCCRPPDGPSPVGETPTVLWEKVRRGAGEGSGSVCSVTLPNDDENRGPTGPIEPGDPGEDDARDAPVGAIAVTSFLAITILVFWFGMFFLNIARSS